MTPTPAPATAGIDATILDLMLRAGSRWVLWVLLALSVAAVAVILERLWFYAREREPRALLGRALGLVRGGERDAALKTLWEARSLEAVVVRGLLARAADGPAAVDELRVALVEQERQRFERGLAFLGTLGNNAPFVGLFGTVLGIIRAVHDLSGSASGNTQAVMAGIAEALVATGVGLMVALPAVAAYNGFTRHVERAAASADARAHELLAELRAVPASAPPAGGG